MEPSRASTGHGHPPPDLIVFGPVVSGGETLAPLRTRALRAFLLAAVWTVSALPTLLGIQRCAVASLFHVPCPGCGMTRALRLLLAGHGRASLRMHPLAVPVLVAGSLLVLATVLATLTTGTPLRFYRSRLGRGAVAFAALAYATTAALWVARWFGHFGGPVPVR